MFKKQDPERSGQSDSSTKPPLLRPFCAVAAIGVTALLLAACGGGSTDSNESASQAAREEGNKIVIEPLGKTDKEPGDLKFGFLTQIAGHTYYEALGQGVTQAGKDLGVDVTVQGPPRVDSSLQAGIMQTWIDQNYDVIILTSTDPDVMTPVINQAIDKGITVLTYDIDAAKSKRQLYVNTYDPVTGPRQLFDQFAKEIGKNLGGEPSGEYAFIITALTSAFNTNAVRVMRAWQEEKYPKMKWVATEATESDQVRTVTYAKQLMSSHPKLTGIFSMDGTGTPGIAQATQELGNFDEVATFGQATPVEMRGFLKRGVVQSSALWNVPHLGYLLTQIGFKLVNGEAVTSGDTLGVWTDETVQLPVIPTENREFNLNPGTAGAYQGILGKPLIYNKETVDDYDF